MPLRLTSIALLAALLLGGLWVTVGNRDLPLVRNSLVYASASRHVLEHGGDPRPVVADSALSYDKPILYAWMSAPFVRAFGSHDGLRITSFLGTVAFLLAVSWFSRSSSGLLQLATLGPCVFYQFWSAHPDTWFAAIVVVAWGLAERIVAEPDRNPAGRVVALGAWIYAAVLFKNYGLVLGISVPLYLLVHVRSLRASAAAKKILAAGLGVFAVLGALVVLAKTGHHPLSRLEGEGGGVGQYGRGVLWTSAKGTWIQLGIALLLQLHVALVFAFRRSAWTRGTWAPLLCFGGIYVAGLMPFPTTFYNMRYFVPLFPLAARILLRGAESMRAGTRRAVLAAHAVVAIALVGVFNLAPLYRRAEPAIPALVVDWIGTPLSLLDNLRMPLHLEQQAVLENIGRQVPAGATLYQMDVGYYRDAQHGVFERDGRIRADIRVEYVSSRSFAPAEATFYVYVFRGRPAVLDRFGAVTDLGSSLYKVDAGK